MEGGYSSGLRREGRSLRCLALRHTGRVQEAATKADRSRGQRAPANICYCGQPDNQQPGPASGAGAQDKGNRGARGPAGGARGRAEGAEERMSTKKGLGRLYDRLTPEERFRLDVLALARGDEEESESLPATCP